MEAGDWKQQFRKARSYQTKPGGSGPSTPPDRKLRRGAGNKGASEHIPKRLRGQEISNNRPLNLIEQPRRRSARLQEKRDASQQRIVRGEQRTGPSLNTSKTHDYAVREQSQAERRIKRALRSSIQHNVSHSSSEKQPEFPRSNLKARESDSSPLSLSTGGKIVQSREIKRRRTIRESQYLSTLLHTKDPKRKQSREAEDQYSCTLANPVQKLPRTSRTDPTVEQVTGEEVAHVIGGNKIDPIDYWRREGIWPKEYFEQQDEHFSRDLEKDSWPRKYSSPNMDDSVWNAYARPRIAPRGKKLTATTTSIASSDQKPRDEKSVPYKSVCYVSELEKKGSFMDESDLDVTAASTDLSRTLLESEQTLPADSIFCDNLFKNACRMIANKNETRVIREIALLIVPSAELLALRGAKDLKILIESVNEGWTNSIPVAGPRPQPDFSVGFKRNAFTDEQLRKLHPYVGGSTDLSLFMATHYLYFPFLTCEVKCGIGEIEIADRQNAHSMTLAVRGIVALFKLVKREKELHREILAFSVSHDNKMVRIYGHYPVIDEKITFYRYPIQSFDFTILHGKERWTAYRFIKNVYNLWMPTHFERLCSVIDELQSNPIPNTSPRSKTSKGSSTLGIHRLSPLNPNSASVLQRDTNEASLAGSQDARPAKKLRVTNDKAFQEAADNDDTAIQ